MPHGIGIVVVVVAAISYFFIAAAAVVAVADVVAADDGVAFQDLVHDLELGEVLHPPADPTMLQKS